MDDVEGDREKSREGFVAGSDPKDEIPFGLADPPILLQAAEPDDPPDGGLQAWTNVSCSCVLMFTVFGFRKYRSPRFSSTG